MNNLTVTIVLNPNIQRHVIEEILTKARGLNPKLGSYKEHYPDPSNPSRQVVNINNGSVIVSREIVQDHGKPGCKNEYYKSVADSFQECEGSERR